MRQVKKFLLFALPVIAVGFLMAADGTIHTWTGKGTRRNTTEMELRSPSMGTAANLIPGTDNANALGTSSLRWSDIQTYDLTLADDLTVSGDSVLGDAAGDTLTINATTAAINSAWGITIGTTTDGTGNRTLRIDTANNRVGVNVAAPTVTLDVAGSAKLGSAVTDIITFTALPRLPTNAAPRTNVTPTAAGELIWNSTGGEICVSSGTTVQSWVKVTSNTLNVACSN